MRKQNLPGFILIFILAATLFLRGNAAADPITIKNGSKVTLDYTLYIDNKVRETTIGKVPRTIIVGQGAFVPGFDRQLLGLKAGDARTFDIESKEGYGEVNSTKFREYPKSYFPSHIRLEAGRKVKLRSTDGVMYPARIIRVDNNSALVDFNHPLAGKTLQYKIKILDVH